MSENLQALEMFPIMGMRAVDVSEANELLTDWQHPLGACRRPFGQQAWLLDIDGIGPIGLAVSASTVSKTITDKDGRVYRRGELVELARVARHPDHPYVLRVMIRLWRAYLAQRWPYWPVSAAVSYSMPGTPGDLYRFDGWENLGPRKRSGGGGTWTIRDPVVSHIGDGIKGLWLWRYEEPQA